MQRGLEIEMVCLRDLETISRVQNGLAGPTSELEHVLTCLEVGNWYVMSHWSM